MFGYSFLLFRGTVSELNFSECKVGVKVGILLLLSRGVGVTPEGGGYCK